MKEQFIKSLQMIKISQIKSQAEYINLANNFFILSLESLKYISQKDNFQEIIKMANEL